MLLPRRARRIHSAHSAPYANAVGATPHILVFESSHVIREIHYLLKHIVHVAACNGRDWDFAVIREGGVNDGF